MNVGSQETLVDQIWTTLTIPLSNTKEPNLRFRLLGSTPSLVCVSARHATSVRDGVRDPQTGSLVGFCRGLKSAVRS